MSQEFRNVIDMSFEEMYDAVIRNDERYDTMFFYAVKSTGIYCRPSCRSKDPKAKNVEFYITSKEAVANGYRPCKRCRSDLLDYNPMKDIAEKLKNLIDDMFNEVETLNSEMDKLGFSRRRIVDVFKQVYGLTPTVYVNDLRYKEATRLLKSTDDEVIDIAYSVGFGSLSAFYKFFKERAHLSPAVYRKESKTSNTATNPKTARKERSQK